LALLVIIGIENDARIFEASALETPFALPVVPPKAGTR
jgi:hypothetical protein